MILEHKVVYTATKTTAEAICDNYECLNKQHNRFYDPKDGDISYIRCSEYNNWEWLHSLRKNRRLYLLEEELETIVLKEEK